jgi:hypothetical protein
MSNSHIQTSKQELKLSVDNALPVQYIGDGGEQVQSNGAIEFT